ncbi:MAG TPA: small ribosomal subunit Rsm22 family protein [Nitrospirales bacterium]|nr:small ribosomal subunit Rsm22 family protein [Nitrospirales bacterium]
MHGLLASLHARCGEPDREVAEGVRALSRLFTKERDALGVDYFADPALCRAYLLYFLPVNVAKVTSLLREMPALPARPLRILDVGSGPGIGALAVLDHLMQHDVAVHEGGEVIAVDCSRRAMQEAEVLWGKVSATRHGGPSFRFHTVTLDLERPGTRVPWKDGAFDLVILANSLNELFRSATDPIARRVTLLEALLDALSSDGTCMIVEPALRETTRDLHHVRDRLVAARRATVYSPCLHERPCPALVHPDDWCHEERPWSPPPMLQAIDREVGFIKDALKFSYLMLRKDGLTVAERGSDVYRVVSEVIVMKGDRRAWLCNETGRPLVGRLDKARSEANAALDRWHRGAIVRVEHIERRATIGRIESPTRVELVRPVEG